MDTQDRWYYNYLHNIHMKKLELIQSKSTGKIDNSVPETFILSKNKSSFFKLTKKKEYEDINKKNQLIMDAINEISRRRGGITQKSKSTGKIDNSIPQTFNISKNKNFFFKSTKKKEFEDIYKKNKIIMDALNEISNRKNATFSVQKLDEEYKLSLKYKKNLTRKFGDTPKKKEKRKKLPKLGKVGGKNKKKLVEEGQKSNEDQKLYWSTDEFKQKFVDFTSGEVELEKSEEGKLNEEIKEVLLVNDEKDVQLSGKTEEVTEIEKQADDRE